MYTIKKLDSFDLWINGLKDIPTKLRLIRRLDRIKTGVLGDIKPVGKGVFEMRERFGPGWRMYFYKYDDLTIIMLNGGNKSTQDKYIKIAIEIANLLGGKYE